MNYGKSRQFEPNHYSSPSTFWSLKQGRNTTLCQHSTVWNNCAWKCIQRHLQFPLQPSSTKQAPWTQSMKSSRILNSTRVYGMWVVVPPVLITFVAVTFMKTLGPSTGLLSLQISLRGAMYPLQEREAKTAAVPPTAS